jgi:hypothetical protein
MNFLTGLNDLKCVADNTDIHHMNGEDRFERNDLRDPFENCSCTTFKKRIMPDSRAYI